MAADLNTITISGRLARDPELRHTGGGTAVCTIRLAYSTSRRDESGQWTDKSNYVDVTFFGNRAETIQKHFHKGKPIGVQGRLEWREWEAQDGTKRQSYEIIADQFVFMGGRDDGGAGGGGGNQFVPAGAGSGSGYSDGGGGGYGGAQPDDDIPF